MAQNPLDLPTANMDAYNQIQAPASHSPVSFQNHQPNRRSANFQPSVWGEHFLAYASSDKVTKLAIVKSLLFFFLIMVKITWIIKQIKRVQENHSEEGQEHERLKEEVRKMLIRIPDKSCRKMELIDTIQRLGLAYHFESEIEESLLSIMLEAYHDHDHDQEEQFMQEGGDDLHMVALRFRLLRQHGHYVSCGKSETN